MVKKSNASTGLLVAGALLFGAIKFCDKVYLNRFLENMRGTPTEYVPEQPGGRYEPRTIPQKQAPRSIPRKERVYASDVQRLVDESLQDLPENGTVEIGFAETIESTPKYSFTIGNGKRVRSGKVGSPDLSIIIEESWVPDLKRTGDFCGLMQKIKKEGGYAVVQRISSFDLATKYGSFMVSQDCF